MTITVTGRHMDVGESLRSHVQAQIDHLGDRYFGRITRGRVIMDRRRSTFSCSVHVHVGRGISYSGRASSDSAPVAFNAALEHAAKQLRRKKRALREDKPVNVDKTL